jgi:hypothetical protein
MAQAASIDTFDLRAQEDAREKAEERARLLAKIEIDDLKWVMRDKRGRRFVHGLLERAGAFRSSFHTNALTMAFNEGTRNEGLRLIDQAMRYCADLYMQMLKEHNEDE